jgi:glycosyltransferase involved in cell wall biosynthesis
VRTTKKVIVLPAYNAEKTLEKTINLIPQREEYEIILVDDFSKDNTFELAKKLGIEAYQLPKNSGYGATQKLCYKKALEKNADIVLMLHPDYQYDPRVVPLMCKLIEYRICDVVLGNRIRTRKEALDGGMPLYKYISNRFLTIINNIVTGQNLGEWHSGLRAYSSKVLKTINWQENSDDFAFDIQFLFQCVNAGFKIGDIPVPVRYFEEASSVNFKSGLKYGFFNLYTALLYILNKVGLKNKLFKTKSAL